MDGAGNRSILDSLSLSVGNLAPPDVKITSPASGTFAIVGKSIIVSVSGKSGVRLKSIGLSTTGAITRSATVSDLPVSFPSFDSLLAQSPRGPPASSLLT